MQRKTSDTNTYWHQRQLSKPGYRLQPQRRGRCPPPPFHAALSPPHTGALCKAPSTSLSLRKPDRRVQCSPCSQCLLAQPARLAKITPLFCCASLFWKIWVGESLSRQSRLSWKTPFKTGEGFLTPSAWLWLFCSCPEHLSFWLGPSAQGVCDSVQLTRGFPNRPWIHSNTVAFQLMQYHREEIPHFPNSVTEQTGFFWQTIHDKRSGVKIIQQDPRNLNISDYGKETSLFSGSGNLWPSQLTTEWRGKGYFWNSEKGYAVSKHSGFQSLCAHCFSALKKIKLGQCTASPFCSHSHLHYYPSEVGWTDKSLSGVKTGATHWPVGFLKNNREKCDPSAHLVTIAILTPKTPVCFRDGILFRLNSRLVNFTDSFTSTWRKENSCYFSQTFYFLFFFFFFLCCNEKQRNKVHKRYRSSANFCFPYLLHSLRWLCAANLCPATPAGPAEKHRSYPWARNRLQRNQLAWKASVSRALPLSTRYFFSIGKDTFQGFPGFR